MKTRKQEALSRLSRRAMLCVAVACVPALASGSTATTFERWYSLQMSGYPPGWAPSTELTT